MSLIVAIKVIKIQKNTWMDLVYHPKLAGQQKKYNTQELEIYQGTLCITLNWQGGIKCPWAVPRRFGGDFFRINKSLAN